MRFLIKRENWFPIFTLIVFAVLVKQQIHGSSLGMYWFHFEGEREPDPALLFGSPRSIRSDEFWISTPWTFAQAQAGFTQVNPLLGGGQDLIMTDAPIKSWETFFRPQNWSFFVLPLKYAFVFRWWFRALLLVLSAYVFFLEWSDGKWPLAALGALSILFMPLVQWWYATTYLEGITYSLLMLFGFRKMVKSSSVSHLMFWAFLFAYASLCFAFVLYIPFLIPSLIYLLLMMVGILLNELTREGDSALSFYAWLRNFGYVLRQPRYKNFFLVVFVVALVDVIVLAVFFLNNQALFDVIANSAYPGSRRVVGGTLSPAIFFGGFFNIALLPVNAGSSLFGVNQSEASSFFSLSFFLLPVLFFMALKGFIHDGKRDYFLVCSLAAYSLLFVWAFFDLPAILRNMLLLNFVPPYRTPIIFGIINHILIFYYLQRVEFKLTRIFVIFASIYSLSIFGIYFFWFSKIKDSLPVFMSAWNIGIWVSIVIFIMLLLLLLQKRLAFGIIFLAFSVISTFSVNPLYRGLGILINSKLSEAVREINAEDQGRSLWVVYDNIHLPNYLAANGVHVLNATQFHPQNDLWAQFDPHSQYEDIYNRYAHISIDQLPDVDRSEFELTYFDRFTLKVNPCNPILEQLGVNYFVFSYDVGDYKCIRLVHVVYFRKAPSFIYQRQELP